MPHYHFSLGNSTSGPIGYCARVTAPNEETAVERLKAIIAEEVDLVWSHATVLQAGEYVRGYINVDAITVNDIDETEEE